MDSSSACPRVYYSIRDLAEMMGCSKATALRKLRQRRCLQRIRVRERSRIWIHWNSLLPILGDASLWPSSAHMR